MNYPYKNVAKWSAYNSGNARWLIFLLSLVSAVFFFEVGLFLPEFNIALAIFIWFSLVTAAVLCFFSYSHGKKLQKRTVIYLILSLLWLHLGNQSIPILSVGDANYTRTVSIAPVKPIVKSEKKIRKFFGKHLAKRKKQLNNSFSGFYNLSPVAAFFIFFLLAILALFIAYILAIISCSLSCSGQVALSYVVFVSAAIFALGGLFLIGYAIYRAYKKPHNNLNAY